MSNVLSVRLSTHIHGKHSAMAFEAFRAATANATAASAEGGCSNSRGQQSGGHSATVIVISSGRPSASKPQAFHRCASAGSFAASKV